MPPTVFESKSQQASCRRPTPWTARAPGICVIKNMILILLIINNNFLLKYVLTQVACRYPETAQYYCGVVVTGPLEVWLWSVLGSVLVAEALRVSKERCDPDRLAVYSLRVQTHWSRELFPKHFPEWRPPAQWSRLVGR